MPPRNQTRMERRKGSKLVVTMLSLSLSSPSLFLPLNETPSRPENGSPSLFPVQFQMDSDGMSLLRLPVVPSLFESLPHLCSMSRGSYLAGRTLTGRKQAGNVLLPAKRFLEASIVGGGVGLSSGSSWEDCSIAPGNMPAFPGVAGAPCTAN